MRYSNYVQDKRYKMKLWMVFFMSCSIIFISSTGITGIPLKEGMTPQEVKAQIEEMKYQREKMARELGQEQQKKEEESAKREQLIQASQPPTPTPAEEKRAVQEKETRKEGEKGEEEKGIPQPTGELGKGLVPGVITPEQESEEAKKISKQEKVEKEYKSQRNFSFILMLIVMIATIGLLIKSMSKGKTKDEEKKK